MVEIYRTPDVAFDGLDDFTFKPNYIEWEGLRTHFLDEGPRDGPVALLLHGEPTWSYLYRKMIPTLVKSGYRCIAPDHIGFGRSDKVLNDEWYVTDRHIERLKNFIEKRDREDQQGRNVGYNNGLYLNQKLATEDKWTIGKIDARTDLLVKEILEMYPLPEEGNE